MHIGKIIKIHDSPRPIKIENWPDREKDKPEAPVEVPNWPKREKEKVESGR